MFQRSNIFSDMPTLGIIPTVDGRLRDSQNLETAKKTAQGVAKLVSASCRNPDGTPVRCVVSQPVGGRAELAKCQTLFRRANVGAVISCSPFWCYSAEVVYPDRRIPQAIYGFNGTERPGAVFEAAGVSHCIDQGIRAFPIYGRNVQSFDQTDQVAPDVAAKILTFVNVGMAAAYMKNTNYLSIGACSMGINGSIPSPRTFRDYFGMGLQFVDMVEIARRMDQRVFDPEEFERARSWVAKNCQVGFDPNIPASPHDPQTIWDQTIQMTMIVQDMMRGNPRLAGLGFAEHSLGFHALLAGFQGQRHWTDYRANGDVMEALCNTTFDWNGVRMPFIVATENDALNGVCMLLGFLLTGTAQIFADLRTYWSKNAVKQLTGHSLEGAAENGLLHHLNSGPACLDGTGQQSLPDGTPTMKPWWDVNETDVAQCLAHTTWHPADKVYFPGGGFSTKFTTRGGMPVTMTRLIREEDGNLVLHIIEGNTVELPQAVHDVLDKRTNPTWPSTWVVPRQVGRLSTYDVMNRWGANHDVLIPGYVGQRLRSLAALLGISIGLTNLDPDAGFLPAQWSVYGDRAMANDSAIARRLGPLYA